MVTINDNKLKSYFLGSLAVEEAELLEEECAGSAELSELAQIVESELTDEYLRGELSAAERRLFEENYLTTSARREKLRLANNIWKVAAENQSAIKTPAPSFWQMLFAEYRMPTLSGLAAAIIFVGGVFVWVNSNRSNETVKLENVNLPADFNAQSAYSAESQNAAVQNSDFNAGSVNYNSQKSSVNALPKQIVAPQIKAMPKPSMPTAPTLAVFALAPGTLRSEGEQFIKIASNAAKIKLNLDLPQDAVKYQSYRVVLQTADGETVYTSTNLKSPQLFLPAKRLADRTYMIFLEGRNASGSAEPIAEYTFRVRR